MKKIAVAVFVSVSLFGCKKEAEEALPVAVESQPSESREKAPPECYLYASDRDTVRLNLVVQDATVNGDLAYRYYEKDKSSGTVSGVVKGDTLVMTYEFMSEGMESKRQVVFLRTASGLTEGYGEVFEKDSAMFFRDMKKLDFPGKIVLEKIVCPE